MEAALDAAALFLGHLPPLGPLAHLDPLASLARLAHVAAFWVAVVCFRGAHPLRFIAGLGLGAVLARIGWAGLHLDQFAGPPGSTSFGAGLDPLFLIWGAGAGFSLLFVPAGPLCLAPARAGAGANLAYAAAASRALAPAFAVARLGCVWAGCCGGRRVAELGAHFGAHSSAQTSATYPTAAWELAGWGAVACLLARAPTRWVPGLFGIAFGGLRLAIEPWRAPPPLGAPLLDPRWIAGAWLVSGLVWLARGAWPRRDRLAGGGPPEKAGPTLAARPPATGRGEGPWSSS